MKLKFNDSYFVLFIIILFFEIAIAVCLNGGFIRHTFGDYLATILLYCFFKSFLKTNAINLGITVLAIAFTIEFAQLINVLQLLHLENYHVIRVVLGTSFSIADLVAYTLGIITVLAVEFKLKSL